MTLTAAEQRVLDALDEQALVADVADLVQVPSLTGSDNEAQLQHDLAIRLEKLGLDVDLWKLDLAALAQEEDYPGMEAPRSEGYGLVATTDLSRTPALVLQGHLDVVPVGDLAKWRSGDPFSGRVEHDTIHGRGACDMKAGVAVNLAVAAALQKSGLIFERPWGLHLVISEEDGGLGAFATMRRGHLADAAVITEPTSGQIVTANAGALTFRLEVPGRAAHGSARLSGVSAIDAFTPLNEALKYLEAARNALPDELFGDNPLPYGISIGTIRAGDWASSVPDLLIAEGRLGVQLDEDPADARQALEEAIHYACQRDPWLRRNPVSVSWPGGQFGPGRIPADHPLVNDMNAAIAAVTGQPAPLAAAPYGSDLRIYSRLGGIPTLHYGPGDVRFAHAPREQVPISEVLDVARALAVLAVRRLDGHLPTS